MYLELAASQVVVLSLFALSYLGIARLYERKASFVSAVRESVLQPVKIKSKALRTLMIAIASGLVVMIFLPILTIIVLSFVKPGTWMIDIYPREFNFDNYINIFTKPRSLAPFANSMKMALLASLTAVFVSIPASYILTKTTSKTRPLIEFMVMLPFAMPASAIAINMINGFSQTLLGTWILLPIAYFVSLLPMAVRSISLSYQRLKIEYAEASKTLGASNPATFLRITLPLIAPGIWAGLLLVFIRSLGEYTISAFLYTASNRPISIAMVNSIFEFNIGLAMAYGALVLALTFIGAALIRKLQSLTE
jgi:iron(III) transport system permease protein